MVVRKNILLVVALVFLLASFLLLPTLVCATKEYAGRTGQNCIYCHQGPSGGPLNAVGLAYIENEYRYPIPEELLIKTARRNTVAQRTIRLIMGYLHLLAAIVFGGAIFYVHIFIKPFRLTRGIPRGERVLGLSCMVVLTGTGIYLTVHRIKEFNQFFTSTFGLMLFVKIMLFALMIMIGLTAVTVLHRLMRKEAAVRTEDRETSELTPERLRNSDGAEGRPAYIVYQNRVYDVTGSDKWREGRHFGRHSAGSDLTDALTRAPHGPEVFEKVVYRGELAPEAATGEKMGTAGKAFVVMAYANLVILFLVLGCVSIWKWGFPVSLHPAESHVALGRMQTGCLDCHQTLHLGICSDWQHSAHAKAGVGCADCHRSGTDDSLTSKSHLENASMAIAVVVTPKICSRCHLQQAAEYGRSKHAHTYEIIWKIDYWLRYGMNNAIERTSGCYSCHGTVVKLQDGEPVPETWPNVGVGRVNPDGSLGSCSSCHTRHKFSVEEARKPEACDQCHLGPDHPQIEIYNESKHGTIYHAEGHGWNWRPDDNQWRAGRDFRAPTCAVCHISAAGEIPATHDTTERLSWELQAPYTVRPSAFEPFPAATKWEEEREKMGTVCLQCHSSTWTDNHFTNLDAVIRNYNDRYFGPAKRLLEQLYSEGVLSKETYFEEDFEWEFYELWHHEGRRARMGAAMMAPDYAWWHGFYELKARLNHLYQLAEQLREAGKSRVHEQFPGRLKE